MTSMTGNVRDSSSDFPIIVREYIPVEADADMYATGLQTLRTGEPVVSASDVSRAMTLHRRISCRAMAKAAVAYLDAPDRKAEKIVVVAPDAETCNELAAISNVAACVLKASDPQGEYHDVVRDFNESAEPKRLFISHENHIMDAHLSGADRLVFLSPQTELATLLQTEGKLTRVGREKPVLITTLVGMGTLDEPVAQAMADLFEEAGRTDNVYDRMALLRQRTVTERIAPAVSEGLKRTLKLTDSSLKL